MQSASKTPEKQAVGTPLQLQQLLAELKEKDHLVKARDHIIAEQQKLLKLMEEQLRLAQLQRFGASSEKASFQRDFFDEAELEAAVLPEYTYCLIFLTFFGRYINLKFWSS